MSASQEFPRVEAHVRSSLLFRASELVANRFAAAAESSATASVLRAMRARFDTLEPHDRIRTIAIAVASGAAGHVLLLRLVPWQLAPALPRSFWLLIVATASVAAVFARQLGAAWHASALRRYWQSGTGVLP